MALNQDLIDRLIELYQLNDQLRKIREALNAQLTRIREREALNPQINSMNESNDQLRIIETLNAQLRRIREREALNPQMNSMNESNVSERILTLMRIQYICLITQKNALEEQKNALILEIRLI